MAEPVSGALKERPLSPHLSVYKLIPTMMMSIFHRITGVALYAGPLLVAWWLIATAMGPEAYGTFAAVAGSPIGIIVLIGFTWALLHHMLGGLRHFLWDTGRGLEKTTATSLAIATIVLSLALTLILWAGFFLMGGA